MRLPAAKQFLVRAISAGLPVLLTSEPGVGKSDLMRQAAAEANADVILSHPVVSDPTDFKGLPWPNPNGMEATFLPFGDLARAMNVTRKTAWVFDDLGQAPNGVQSACMQLFLSRSINGHALPDEITFLAATNRRTDRANVTGILEPVKSRFVTILALQSHIDDWAPWALDANLPAELIAFLRFRPDLLCDFKPSADMTNSPLPRTWAHAAKILGLQLSPAMQHEVLIGSVGEGAATELAGFLKLVAELPNIDQILKSPATAPIPDKSPATLYAVVTALGMRTTVETFPNIAIYAQRLYDAGHGEFSALLVRDTTRKDRKVMSTPAFVKLCSGPLGQLIAGGGK